MLTRRIPAMIICIALAVPLHAVARADAAADVKRAIQGLYSKRDSAAEKKDVNATLSTLAPDFVYVSVDGQKGDAKLLKRRLTPLFTMMQAVKSKSEVQKLALKGKVATATVKQHLEMLVLDPQTQVPRKFVADATSEDVWTKSSSGWLQKRMTTKSEKADLDGKSVAGQLKLGGKPTNGNSPTKTEKKKTRPKLG